MTSSQPPITNRQQLIDALKDAAELEHNFMCMYLYTAFSIKKNPDPACTKAELEALRRWASRLYMVARQEMEHLSLVNSLLAAIGAPPHYSRTNFPRQHRSYASAIMAQRFYGDSTDNCADRPIPCDFPFSLEPFSLSTIHRYTCMESAKLSNLAEPQPRQSVKEWCFQKNGKCPSWPEGLGQATGLKSDRRHKDEGVEVGTIAKDYQRIRDGFETLSQDLGSELFVGPSDQHQVTIPNEYDIYLFPVTDLASALNAMDLILKQGEGLDAPPDYNSHFLNFYTIAEEYAQLNREGFDPARPVPHNWTEKHVERAIHNPFTRQVFDLFNYSYVTLLYVLTGLYGWYQPPTSETSYPYLSTALREIAFGPAMTMIVRYLGEILVQLPLDESENEVAAPTFFITDGENSKLTISTCDPKKHPTDWQSDERYSYYKDIAFYLPRFEKIYDDSQALLDTLENNRPLSILPLEKQQGIKTQLEFLNQNTFRIAGNLRQIYQTGFYSKFEGVT